MHSIVPQCAAKRRSSDEICKERLAKAHLMWQTACFSTEMDSYVMILTTNNPPWPANLEFAPLQTRMQDLCSAATAPLTIDHYESARRNPYSSKFMLDGATVGATYALRHGHRDWVNGRKLKSVGVLAPAPILIGAAVVAQAATVAAALVCPDIAFCAYNKTSRKMRSEEGTRENLLCANLSAIRTQLRDLDHGLSDEQLRLGNITAADIALLGTAVRHAVNTTTQSEGLSPRVYTSSAISQLRRKIDRSLTAFEHRATALVLSH